MKSPVKKEPRIFCLIITMAPNHDTKAKAIRRTWARRCDGHVFTSTKGDSYLPAFAVSSNTAKIFLNTRLQKSLEVVHDQYMSEFDWLYVADDDTYCIVENLRHFLKSFDHRQPRYLGFAYPTSFNKKDTSYFAHGGSGYALSTVALERYIHIGLNKTQPLCPRSGPFAGDQADCNVGFCMWKLGIHQNSTVDSYGRQRFVKENPISILRDVRKGEILFFGYRDIITTPKRVG